jgi:Flp pilus assembly protein TadG
VGEGLTGLTALRVGSGRVSASNGGGPVGLFGRLRGERGQGVVEFAMILPLLGALVLIFIQFGKAINYWIDLTHVANEGARYATVGAPGSSNLKAAVCSTLETKELKNGTGEVNAAKVTVTYPNTTRDVGDPVNVKVAATYHWLPFWNAGSWNIQGSATMRLERDSTGNTALDPGTGTCPTGT